MALSNILNQPMKEISESLLGFGALSLYLVSCWPIAVWLRSFDQPEGQGPILFYFFIGALILGMAIVALLSFMVLIHFVGEVIAEKLGIDDWLDAVDRPKGGRLGTKEDAWR